MKREKKKDTNVYVPAKEILLLYLCNRLLFLCCIFHFNSIVIFMFSAIKLLFLCFIMCFNLFFFYIQSTITKKKRKGFMVTCDLHGFSCENFHFDLQFYNQFVSVGPKGGGEWLRKFACIT